MGSSWMSALKPDYTRDRMQRTLTFSFGLFLMAASCGNSGNDDGGEATLPNCTGLPDEIQAFVSDHCWQCHAGAKPYAGFHLETIDDFHAIPKGGSKTRAETAAKKVLDQDDPMPQKSAGGPLPESETKVLRDWVAAGAPGQDLDPECK